MMKCDNVVMLNTVTGKTLYHFSITSLQHYIIISFQHYIILSLQHYLITALQPKKGFPQEEKPVKYILSLEVKIGYLSNVGYFDN